MALQVRRGTNAERLGITPAAGELIFTTDTKQLYVGDGTTAGGITSIAGTIDSLLADTTPQLGGTLDLNNHDITGTGNINITGTIQASGNINLGDGVGSDVINIGGVMSGDLVPNADATHDLGSTTAYWKEAFISQLTVDSQITAERVQADIIADDSTIVFNSATGQIAAAQITGTFTGNVIGSVTGSVTGNVTGTLDGDVTGSVFGDDSTPLVDANNNVLTASKLTIPVIAPTDPAGGITFETPGEPSRLLLQRNSDSAIGDTTPVGRLIFGYKVGDALPVTITSVSVTNDQLAIIPQPGGTPNYNNYMKLYKTGTVQISMAGEISNAPGDAKLEVGGAVLYEPMTTTVRDALTAEAGMVVFNTTDTKLQVYDGSAWADLH
jgi:hypothetical protein